MTKSEALQQRRELVKLVEQWARAEVMSRMGRFDNLAFADYSQIALEKRDEIWELVLGSSDLVVLGARWDMITPKQEERRKKKNKKI